MTLRTLSRTDPEREPVMMRGGCSDFEVMSQLSGVNAA
jgi:hypothetical protein